MNNLHTRDKELQSIAVLHDLIEDTNYTLEHLREFGFSERVISAVAALTHDKKIPYQAYIDRISGNEDARLVKLSDLRDNSDITRLKGLSTEDYDRMEKYHWAYLHLSGRK
jgi:(p)ppGpp synthase/HD superfamily hydrolase